MSYAEDFEDEGGQWADHDFACGLFGNEPSIIVDEYDFDEDGHRKE